MIVILFSLFLFFAPIRALAQSDLPPNPSSFLDIGYSYTEPSDTAREFDVYIDGQFYSDHYLSGITPGGHHLKCTKPGHLDYETTFVFPIESVRCYFSKTAILTINVGDSSGNKLPASVTIDDIAQGEFDSGSIPLARGLHKITCKKEGYKKYSSEVTITNFVPSPVGIETPSYYQLQCVLERLGFWGNLWDKFLTFLSNLVKRSS